MQLTTAKVNKEKDAEGGDKDLIDKVTSIKEVPT